jgi:flavin reductase (DIM6/NTAB) family NADH-FMN oxidoreductase RutF
VDESSSRQGCTPVAVGPSARASGPVLDMSLSDGKEELDDGLINRVTWKIPNALALVGSRAGDERNAMTTSWITQLSMEPVLIGIGVDNTAVTHRLITESQVFSLNLWDAEDTRVFVKFSKPASYDDGELNGRAIRDSPTGSPIFEEALAWIDCAVRHAIDFGTHTLFAGEIVAAGINDDEARPASLADTRMKYGGVKRGGHG